MSACCTGGCNFPLIGALRPFKARCGKLPDATHATRGHEICWIHITTPKHIYLLLVLYHPPKRIYNSPLFIQRLVADIDELAYEYPDAIMYITGDFNRLNISQALTDTGLSQLVSDCTRGRHTLDLFITNRPHFVTCKAVQSCISTDHSALLTTTCGHSKVYS